MTVPVSKDPGPDLLRFALKWFEQLASGDIAGALGELDRPSSYGIAWTEAELQRVLLEYGVTGISAVSAPSSIAGALPSYCTSFGEFDDGSGYWLDCSFPLGGAWSDLTAQFEFITVGETFAVSLQDVHVL